MTAPAPYIVFVDFDEDTFQRIQKWPIPRKDVAEVIRRIGAQKPRVVGLDILISEPREADEDKDMQDALTLGAGGDCGQSGLGGDSAAGEAAADVLSA